MRVTQRRLIEDAAYRIAELAERKQKSQSVVGTGKKIQKPEDDPIGAGRALAIRSHLSALEATKRNLSLTTDWLSASETALQGLNDALNNAQRIAVNAADESAQSDAGFAAWSNEIREAISHVVEIGNSSHRGLYLFSGRKVDTAPFQLETAPTLQVTYHGDSGVIEHPAEEGVRIQANVPGSDPLFQKTFDSLINLYENLQASDTAGIQSSIAELDDAADSVLESLAVIGSRAQRIDATNSRLQNMELDLRSVLSNTEDADMAEAMLNLRLDEQSYEALLAGTARLFGSTLMDYLG